MSSPNSIQADHDELLEPGMADSHSVSAEQGERLSMSVKRLNQSSDRIKECRRTILETQELGSPFLKFCINSDRHAHNKLYDVDDAIDKSKKVLTSMSRRIIKNKWIIVVIIALVLAIILILYYKISHH
ncbi:vesicle transport v-SNARE 12-like [Hibiscus syriacus]|uniref:vesicle transport v-SNARE 12-like n=1 Tax=Hibiscus syriacus TaxID=106335 RepID=UPI0019226198|nr:vesicle transport v-SNARE 12-like [Hibiscus syriacus]XP_039018911.1 vesicle transport v-SNARE 12-like [Hibiscus syriacus]